MSQLLGTYAGILPTVALLIFVICAALVVWHLCADRRTAHRTKMETLALADDQQVPHV